jgi:hypothetical protein
MTGGVQSVQCQPLLGWLFDNRAPALKSPESGVQLRAPSLHKAKERPWPPWRLIATHPNSEIELTHWNQRALTISNRKTNRLCSFQSFSLSLLLPGESVLVRPSQPTNHDSRIITILIANGILESPVTRSEHMTEPGSNREKLRGAPKHSFTSFRSPRASRLTWAAGIFSPSPLSHFLHSYCDACNIPSTKSRSGVHFVNRSEDVIASHLALLIVRDVSNLNQQARGGRTKK